MDESGRDAKVGGGVMVAVVAQPADPQMPDPQAPEQAAAEQEIVEDELLVEEVSIDGMCGVY